MSAALLKENIALFVKQKSISVSKLERNAGLTKNYVSNLIRHKSAIPSIDAVAKIAAALGVSIDELFGNEKKPTDQIFNLVIARKDIFCEIINYLLTAISAGQIREVNFEKFVHALHEIYLFSLKEGVANKNFSVAQMCAKSSAYMAHFYKPWHSYGTQCV